MLQLLVRHTVTAAVLVAVLLNLISANVRGCQGGSIASENFGKLGTVYIHSRHWFTQQLTSHSKSSKLLLRIPPNGMPESANVSLRLTRTLLSSHSDDVDQQQELQCYAVELVYTAEDAFHASLSMHRLAHQALLDLQSRKRNADAALDESAKPKLHKGTVLATHQVHHRLRALAQKRIEAAVNAGTMAEPGDSLLERQEGRVFEALRTDAEAAGDEASSTPPLFSPLNLWMTAASPSPMSHSWTRSAQHRTEKELTGDSKLPFGLPFMGLPDLTEERPNSYSFQAPLDSPESRPQSATPLPESAEDYFAAGDMVVAAYFKTNNWKHCRNVQHGLYFNVSAGSSYGAYSTYRCLLSLYLVDVCAMVSLDPTDNSWKWTRGCADDGGSIFRYSKLRYPRADTESSRGTNREGLLGSTETVLPLTIRVCLDEGSALAPKGIQTATPTDNITPMLRADGARRVIMEAYERQYPSPSSEDQAVVRRARHSAAIDWSRPVDGDARDGLPSWIWLVILCAVVAAVATIIVGGMR